jgi:hypothetical protein
MPRSHILIRIFASKRSQPVIAKFNRYTISYLLQQKCAQVPQKMYRGLFLIFSCIFVTNQFSDCDINFPRNQYEMSGKNDI